MVDVLDHRGAGNWDNHVPVFGNGSGEGLGCGNGGKVKDGFADFNNLSDAVSSDFSTVLGGLFMAECCYSGDGCSVDCIIVAFLYNNDCVRCIGDME